MAGDGLPYTVLGELGKGGTAEVLRIRVPNQPRELALKRILPGSPDTAAFAKLVAREKMFAAGHRFPGITRVYPEFCGSDCELAMELVSGPTLEAVGKIADPGRAIVIMSALATTLAYVHASRVIHGDIKPHNFFLPMDWGTGPIDRLFYTKISDFAFSRYVDETESAREGLGTFGYMAPETIREKRTSVQADLFSLGVVYYQMLSGMHPFMEDGVDPVRINARVQEDAPRPLGELRPDLPHPVLAIVQKLMEKDPSRRIQSAWEVAESLAAAGSTYPLSRAIRPAHLSLRGKLTSEGLLQRVSLTAEQSAEMTLYGDSGFARLHRIVSWNVLRGNCLFNGEHFSFRGRVLLPPALVRMSLDEIRSWPTDVKRTQIVQSVSELARGTFSSTTTRVMAASLHPATVRRTARRLSGSSADHFLPCGQTRLHLMSGNLAEAAQFARGAAQSSGRMDCPVKVTRLLSRVVELAHLSGKLYDVRDIMMLRGDMERENGEIDTALETYQAIVGLYAERPPDSLLAETYKDIGDICKSKRQFSAGIDALSKARHIYESIGDKLGLSRTLNNLGNIYWVTAELPVALKYYRQALRTQRELESSAEVASSLNNIGSIFALKGNFRRALRLYELSLRHKRELGNKLEIARTLNNIGYVHASSGHHDEAIPALQESLELNSEVGNNHEILYNLENLTSVLLLAGRLRESLEPLKRGVLLSEEISDFPHLAVMLLNKGVAMARMGFYSEGEKLFTDVDQLLTKVDNPLLRCELFTHRAAMRWRLGDTLSARELANTALTISDEHTSKQHAVAPLMLLARTSGEADAADRARTLISELSLSREQTLLTAALIESHFAQHPTKPPDERIVAELSRGVASMREDIELPSLLALLGESCFSAGKLTDATELVTRGIRHAERSSLLPELTALYAVLGRIRLQSNEFEEAHAAVSKGTQILVKICSGLRSESDREFLLNVRAYRSLAEDTKRISARLGTRVKGQTR